MAVTFTGVILSLFLSSVSRKSDWHKSASRSQGRSMKSNIWGTTGKEEARSLGGGGSPSRNSPHYALLTFMGSSAEHHSPRRINNIAAEGSNKKEHPRFESRKN